LNFIDAEEWFNLLITSDKKGLSYDILMHSRLLVESDRFLKIYHQPSMTFLLTNLIKKHCVDILKELNFKFIEVDFIEENVSQVPAELFKKLMLKKRDEDRAKFLNHPLAQYLSKLPGVKMIED
jgi:hypothetical protein